VLPRESTARLESNDGLIEYRLHASVCGACVHSVTLFTECMASRTEDRMGWDGRMVSRAYCFPLREEATAVAIHAAAAAAAAQLMKKAKILDLNLVDECLANTRVTPHAGQTDHFKWTSNIRTILFPAGRQIAPRSTVTTGSIVYEEVSKPIGIELLLVGSRR